MWWLSGAVIVACWSGVIWPLPVLLAAGLIAPRVSVRLPFFAMALVYALALMQLHTALAARLPEPLHGKTLNITARVVDIPADDTVMRYGQRRSRQRLIARVDGSSAWPGRHRVALTGYDLARTLHAGDLAKLQIRLYQIHGHANLAGRDRQRQALAQGLDARGIIKAVSALQPGRGLLRWRAQCSAWLARQVALSPAGRAILPALLVGDRSRISPALWRTFRATGTAHLLAISGLHVAIVALWGWLLGRWLLMSLLQCFVVPLRRFALQQLAWLPALAVAGGYAALAGFSLPTVRALLMLALVAVSRWLKRDLSLWQTLGLALLLVLLASPLACLAAGSWLSFGAVAAIALLTTSQPGWRLTVCLPLVMMVAGAMLFGQWTPAAPLANLMLVPVYASVVIPLAMVGLATGSSLLLQGAATVIEGSLGAMQGLQQLLPAWSWALPGPLAGVCLLLALLWWLMPVLPLPRRLLPLLLLPWLTQRPAVLPDGALEVSVFDVGQGEAVAVRTAHHWLLYDTGPGWPGGSMAKTTLLPWMARLGQRPDRVMVSHGDRDHAGGLKALPAGLRVWSGEPARVPGSHYCHAGQHWRWDGVRFAVLWPPRQGGYRGNNASCVLQVTGRRGSVLLTGDIERPAEYALLGTLKHIDLLQLPHHGSHTSNSPALLRALTPRWAVATVGFHNRFGHPAPAVRSRLAKAGITLLRTDRDGMIVFRWDAADNAPLITRWRLAHGRPWYGVARWRLW